MPMEYYPNLLGLLLLHAIGMGIIAKFGLSIHHIKYFKRIELCHVI